MAATASQLSIEIYNKDYYGLDCVFYTEADTIHFSANGAVHAKFIVVAIEIENTVSTTAKEINKLQLFNTPLKVLITYASNATQQKYLDRYSKMITAADIFQDFSTHRKQLVIFGSTNGITVSWTFHVYDDGGFKQI